MADVAQLVEQSIRNRQVIGSSPIVGSIIPVACSSPWKHQQSSRSLAEGEADHAPSPLPQAQDRVESKTKRGLLERRDIT
jgi:hypothetical protein